MLALRNREVCTVGPSSSWASIFLHCKQTLFHNYKNAWFSISSTTSTWTLDHSNFRYSLNVATTQVYFTSFVVYILWNTIFQVFHFFTICFLYWISSFYCRGMHKDGFSQEESGPLLNGFTHSPYYSHHCGSPHGPSCCVAHHLLGMVAAPHTSSAYLT